VNIYEKGWGLCHQSDICLCSSFIK